eukprot:TRINITY_DN15805_c0_g1_i1.p1 TRINITY_DN15805_c0_g1~~TRINITY_DN15805_c0_g1_i1.p1  ORF type:complete len:104 (+),score=16.24 TRINITY_DN15805_c0_g1_i1:77-388(+)
MTLNFIMTYKHIKKLTNNQDVSNNSNNVNERQEQKIKYNVDEKILKGLISNSKRILDNLNEKIEKNVIELNRLQNIIRTEECKKIEKSRIDKTLINHIKHYTV